MQTDGRGGLIIDITTADTGRICCLCKHSTVTVSLQEKRPMHHIYVYVGCVIMKQNLT